jgi:hypothetical protein
MNKRETFEPAAARKQDWRVLLATLAPAIAGIRGVILADIFQQMLFSNLNNYPLTVLLFVWLFGTMMWCAFSVVRHAEAVAERLLRSSWARCAIGSRNIIPRLPGGDCFACGLRSHNSELYQDRAPTRVRRR